jgi:choline-sulfatase
MKNQPNILWILTDEHNRDVAGFTGDPIVSTDNLDRLAARSVCFKNATCTNPVCTPSRMSLMTGREAHRCGAWSNHWAIFPEHVTWPAHFASHGYCTCLVGKMHFGGRDQMNGFQHRPYGDLRHGLGHQPDPLNMYPGYGQAESAGTTEVPESLIQDVIVTRETMSFLLEHQSREPDTPWFACASYSRPHPPFTAPGRYIRRYRGRVGPAAIGRSGPGDLEPFAQRMVSELTDEQEIIGREGYYACVDFVDDCVGELLNGLEQTGLTDNTIIIYTSDHGEMLGLHGCWGKQVYHDASIGAPLLICGPGLPEGKSVKHPVSLMDLFPTACAMAGLPIPPDLDGIDVSDLVYDPESVTPTRLFTPSATYRYGVRIKHGQTLEDTPSDAWRCVRDERWKYVEVERGATLLFDLDNDPLETANLANDSTHAARCRKMREWLYRDFSWDEVHSRLAEDRSRLPEFLSGYPPGTPNQYMLPDGRLFDAEKSLYDARWLPIPPGCTGGIIPQEFG